MTDAPACTVRQGGEALRFRPHAWINTETLEEMFGIQASRGKQPWRHLARAREVVLFKTAADRDRELDRLRAAALEAAPGKDAEGNDG